jgi:signal transduction histidine kinase
MDHSRVRGALAALRRTFAGPDYPPVRLTLPRWRWLATGGPTIGVLALIGLTLITAQYLLDSRHLPVATAWLIALLTVAPLPLLLTRPLLAWRIMFVGQLFGTFNRRPMDVWPWSPTQVLIIVAVLAVVATRVDRAVLAWIGFFSLIPVWIFVPPKNQVGVALLFVVLLILGDLLGRNVRTRRALAEQAEVSELEKARRAVLEERTRIARELHDVVAHHMSMIAVQAETAPYRLGAVPEPARTEFTAIAGAARAALTDMRRLLGVLRSEYAGPETTPQPGLADLAELVESARRAGMTVVLDDAEPPAGAAAPPEAVGLAAYRIVQEALANAARHAAGQEVRVCLTPGPAALEVRVDNDIPGGVARPAGPPGHGLTGMRERALLLGGTFDAGRRAGRFWVTARLPYEQENPPS